MGLSFQILASGSKGNAIVVSSSRTSILLDAGLSGRELAFRFDKTPFRLQDLDALVVSHEHQDHVLGAGVVSRRFDLPVYLTRGTLEHLPPKVGHLSHVQVFRSGIPFEIGDLRLHPFSTCHDAHESVGFVIEHQEIRLGVCTDLGAVTQLVRARLEGCQGLVIESNHDINLLLNGPYPPHLKQRIRSRHGHLSNEDTCDLLRSLHHSALRCVALAHLSETNNHPNLVLQSLLDLRSAPEWENVSFQIGRQHEVNPPEELG